MRWSFLVPALAVSALMVSITGCSKERTARKMLDATGEVCVVLTVESLTTSGPQSPNEVRRTRWDDFTPSFDYRQVTVDGRPMKAIVAYTAPALVPKGSVYLTATPNQMLDYARKDAAAEALVVNPESPASTGLVTRDRFDALAKGLTARKPKPRGISVAM